MAKFNLSQIIKTGDAKQRILLIVVVVLVLLLVLFLLSKLIHLGSNSAGDSRVSGVPSIASVQGGKVSPEYERALNASNAQRADYAKSTGTSAIPTLINTGISDLAPVSTGCTNCCNACGGESTDQMLGSLLNSGKISSSTADLLNNLASQNLSPEDYEAALAQMVREGKISPEEARRLLASYKQNYQDKIAAAGAKDLDPLVKQGLLSVSAASELLDLQKQPAALDTYNQALASMVSQGKLGSDTARLLQQKYQQQQEKRLAAESEGQLASMQASGQLSSEAAGMLNALQASGLSPSDYAAALDKLVREGKLSPEEAKRLLAQYNKLHGITSESDQGPTGMELTKEQGDTLKALQQQNVSVAEFSAKLEQYARAGEISADTASRLLTAYQEEYSAKQSGDTARAQRAAETKDQLISALELKAKVPNDVAQQLAAMRSGSASLSDYASELQRLIDSGLISPETARALLATYKQQQSKNGFATNGNGTSFGGLSSPAIDINLGSSGNAKLDRVAQAGLAQQSVQAQQRQDYTAAAAFQQKNQQMAALQQAEIQQLSDKMYAQAQQLFSPMLTPPVQVMVTGSSDSIASAGGVGGEAGAAGEQGANTPTIIKAGSVLYAVLDTAVDSDYPDTPVMATIVSGEYKGAKLLGSIKTVRDGQRVMLAFNLMTMDAWPTGTAVNAFAIDPDSARSAVATSVDNHYMLRYGTLFAASFLQGLGQAVQNSGTTVSSDSGVVTQSTANLNTQETILVALGQVGQGASGEIGKLQNTPPTVKVKAGIGIGILFMGDVHAVAGAPTTT